MQRRHVEELMMKLLLRKTNDEDITIIKNYFMYPNQMFIIPDIREYFDTIILEYCLENIDEINLTIKNIQLKEDFKKCFISLIKKLWLINQNAKSLKYQLNMALQAIPSKELNYYFQLLKFDKEIYKDISQVQGIRLIFDILINGKKENESSIISFINTLYLRNNQKGKNILYKRIMNEILILECFEKQKRIIELLIHANEQNYNGIPVLVFYHSLKIIAYEVTIIIDNNSKIYQLCGDMTSYELFTMMTIAFNINIDLYDIQINDSTNYILQSNLKKTIAEINTDNHCNLILRLKIKEINSQINNDSLYFDGNKLKDGIKIHLFSLFSDNNMIETNSLFSYINDTKFQREIKSLFTNKSQIDKEILLQILESKTAESFTFLHLIIGFDNGDINQSYFRNIFPLDLFRNKLKTEALNCKQHSIFYKVIYGTIDNDYDLFYCLLMKYNQKIDTIFEDIPSQLKVLYESKQIYKELYKKELSIYNEQSKDYYRIIYLFLQSNIDYSRFLYEYTDFQYPQDIWNDQYFCKIWLFAIQMHINSKNCEELKTKLFFYLNDAKFTLTKLKQWELIPHMIFFFDYFKNEEKNSYVKLIFELIDYINIQMAFSETISSFLAIMIKIDQQLLKEFKSIINDFLDDEYQDKYQDKISGKINNYSSVLVGCKNYLSVKVFKMIEFRLTTLKNHFLFTGIEDNLKSDYYPLNHILIQLYHYDILNNEDCFYNLTLLQHTHLKQLVELTNSNISWSTLHDLYKEYDLIIKEKGKISIHEIIKEILTKHLSSDTIGFYTYGDTCNFNDKLSSELIVSETQIKNNIPNFIIKLSGYIELNRNKEDGNEIITSFTFQENVLDDTIEKIKKFESNCKLAPSQQSQENTNYDLRFYFYVKIKNEKKRFLKLEQDDFELIE